MMTKRTKRRRSKKRRPDFLHRNRLLLILMAVAGLAVFSLVLLARMEEAPSAPVVPPAAKPQVDFSKKVLVEVESFLSELNLGADDISLEAGRDPARYTIESEPPSAQLIADFQARLKRISGDYATLLIDEKSLVIEKNQQTKILIHFVPPAPESQLTPEIPSGPLLTIIMDDLGRSTYTAKRLIAISQQVTFSILPGEPQAIQVAEMAYAAGREVLLHVPMEPQGYPAVNPGSDALFIKYNDAEILRRFDKFLAKIPHVSGSNNHMGSRFTEDERALTPVMKSLQERGLFFIDSRTTGRSRVSEVADSFGVPTMNRDVFLDNVAQVDAITREIRRLESKARRQGMAIGICHPYPETLEALRKELPGLADRGITIVPVSVLLQRQALAQGS